VGAPPKIRRQNILAVEVTNCDLKLGRNPVSIETNRELALKIEELERTVSSHDENIQLIFQTIKEMILKKSEPMEPVGFKIPG